MTTRLYLDDPYQTEFEASVVRRVEVNGKLGLILNQTCFYPTAGGQPCDRGSLNQVPVVDVLEKDDEVLHVLEGAVDADRVHGRILWERRFDFMQQHSGQHVLSGSVLRVLDAHTVSSNLGEETSSIEIARGDLTDRQLKATEESANGIVFENRAIKTYFLSADEVASLPVRKIPPQRDRLRIVEIEDFDYSACGGTHCRQTGEIGLIKIGRRERVRRNVRLHFLCGARALADYRWKSQMLDKLAGRYSAKATDVLDLVTKQAEENKELQRRLGNLSERALELEAHALLSKAVLCGDMKLVQAIFDRRPFDEVKSLARRIADIDRAVVLLANRGKKGQLAFSCSEGLPYDMNDLMSDACAMLEGSGGGSPNLAFGGGPLVENVEKAVRGAFERMLKGE
jgi:alanyl-tRNA synthetase